MSNAPVFRSIVCTFAFVSLAVLVLVSGSPAQSRARITQEIDNHSLVLMKHTTHPLAALQNDRGRVDPGLRMERMLLVLSPTPEQDAAMQQMIDDLHNPDSLNYQHWLTPEQFGAKFGPSDEDVAKITGWLRQQGFEVRATGRGKQYIEFSGSAGQVESAFRTEMHNYDVRGEKHIANAIDISLPQALSPVVQGVLSLHNFPKKANHGDFHLVHRDAVTGKLVSDFTLSNAQGSAHFTAPGDFARIYDTEPLLKQKINGAGVSIAVMARSNINLSDVQTFRKIFGLPANDPIFILNGLDPGVGPDEGEADIDVEWSGAAAPEATIKFVLSASTTTTDGIDLSIVHTVDNVIAPIMTSSFSGCELFLGPVGNAFFKNIYKQAAAEGITAFSSTGDDGPAACDPQVSTAPAQLAAVSGLASTPFETAVGGTQFAENGLDGTFWEANNRPDLSSATGYIPEAVWNESCDPTKDPGKCGGTGLFFMVAGSGGPSSCLSHSIVNNTFVCNGGYPKPSWQAGIGVPNDGVRDIPDLALDAGGGHDGYLLCSEGSCQTTQDNGQTILQNAAVVGGTSVSTPAMAGIMALVEQRNGSFQGLANFNIYKLAANDKLADCNSTNLIDPTTPAACVFHDVTTGINTVPFVKGYAAQTGYDMSTGVGTVDAANLVAAWSSVPKLKTATVLTSGPITVQHGQPVPISVAVKPTAGTGAPTGVVSLVTDKFGGVVAGALSTGHFTGNVFDLPGGQYNVHAHYPGDAMFGASDSGSVAVNISPENSVLHIQGLIINLGGFVATLPPSVLYGQPMAFELSVNGASQRGVATGTIAITDNGNLLTTVPLASGHAFVEVDNLPAATGLLVGRHVLAFSYSGDNSFKPATSGQIKVAVEQKTPITAIEPVPGTITVGDPERLILLVGAAGLAGGVGVEAPTGTVQVLDNGNPVSGQIPIVFTGPEGPGAAQAIFNLPNLAVGSHSLQLNYSGDSNYNPVNSFPFAFQSDVTVNPVKGIAPILTFQQTPAVLSLGQTTNYIVTVRPPKAGGRMPTGTVSIMSRNGGVLVGPQPLVNGNATLVLTFAGVNAFEVAASYSGDKTYSPESSAILVTQVNPGNPTVRLTAASANVAANTQTSLTVTVVGAPNNPIINNLFPSGTVQFMDSVNGALAQPLSGPQSLIFGNGSDSVYTLPAVLPSGTNVITVEYSGDQNWAAKRSNPVTVTVK
jgi:hypothetical protein